MARLRRTAEPAENRAILLRFSALRLTGSKSVHCYTFEYFASGPGVIRSNYYYLY
jgi:hypothetical protein